MKHPSTVTSSRDFQRVLDGGRRRRSAIGSVYVLPSPAATATSRLGLIVSRRVGGAVVRNRVKRRLRAAFASAWAEPGFDVIVRAEGTAATAPFQELEKSLKGAV